MDAEKLLNSVFNYFLSLSHTESRRKVIMGSERIRSFVELLIKACSSRPYLTPCGLYYLFHEPKTR